MTFDPTPAEPAGLALSHLEFQVADLTAAAAELTTRYGFTVAGGRTAADGSRSLALRQGQCLFVLTRSAPGSRGAAYLAAHGDGVADIVLTVTDVHAAFTAAVARGATPVSGPAPAPDGGGVRATIAAFGDVVHTFTAAGPVAPAGLPSGFRRTNESVRPSVAPELATVDHLAIAVEAGRLRETSEFYQRVLGFREVFTERTEVHGQVMNSAVVQDGAQRITLVIVEPDPDADPGVIDAFLERHGCPGVQHIALSSRDILHTVRTLREAGVDFLHTPDTYYRLLADRLGLSSTDAEALRQEAVLVDEDQDGRLFQIFTRSTHPRRTLFFEIIQRVGATTFGSGNIKALYEAIEAERSAKQVAV